MLQSIIRNTFGYAVISAVLKRKRLLICNSRKMAKTELKDKRYIVWEYERKVKEVEERKEGVKGWGGKVRQVVWRGRCKRARVESGVAAWKQGAYASGGGSKCRGANASGSDMAGECVGANASGSGMADEGVGGVSEWGRECRGSIDEPVAGQKHN